jgi:hypothetical protein
MLASAGNGIVAWVTHRQLEPAGMTSICAVCRMHRRDAWSFGALCVRPAVNSSRGPPGGMTPTDSPRNSRERQKSSLLIPYQVFLVLFQ